MVFESFLWSFWYLLIFVFALRKKYCINWAIALCFVQFHKNSRIQHLPYNLHIQFHVRVHLVCYIKLKRGSAQREQRTRKLKTLNFLERSRTEVGFSNDMHIFWIWSYWHWTVCICVQEHIVCTPVSGDLWYVVMTLLIRKQIIAPNLVGGTENELNLLEKIARIGKTVPDSLNFVLRHQFKCLIESLSCK